MKKYDIAAYIWPSYHYEPRLERFWPEKDGEWYTVRRMTARFPGHEMPRVPLLGYQDEADPAVGRQHVEMAAKYGVNTFIMDWYWYENQPCLERQLNEALIPALENSDSKFYLMWANHNVTPLWNMHTDDNSTLIWDGGVNREIFEPMMDRLIDKYFHLKSYYRIDGKPVLSIFLLAKMCEALGGLEAGVDAIKWLRARVVEKGLPGIHLQTIARRTESNMKAVKALGIDSATYYNAFDCGIGEGDYVRYCDNCVQHYKEDCASYPMFFPHASVGWDATPRYPSMKHCVTNSNPYAFEAALRQAKAFADAHPGQPPLITINSWNEWTEGSYLLPDTRWAYGYLEAIRKVFVYGD